MPKGSEDPEAEALEAFGIEAAAPEAPLGESLWLSPAWLGACPAACAYVGAACVSQDKVARMSRASWTMAFMADLRA